jgi:hypothetical protein
MALFLAYFNFCRMHSTIKTTPPKANRLTNEPWSPEKLLAAEVECSNNGCSGLCRSPGGRKEMRQLIAGIVLVTTSIFLGSLSAAIGDPGSFSRNRFLHIEPYWPLGTLAICCFLLGVMLIVFSRKSTSLRDDHEQSDGQSPEDNRR